MMKQLFTCLVAAVLCLPGQAQGRQQDSLAILLIDRMSDVIGDLESCHFTVQSSRDVVDTHGLQVKQFTQYEVYLSGNDKLLVNAQGPRGHRALWFNAGVLAHYNQEEKNYALLRVPEKTIEMIDSVSKWYEMEFPAADFFYPTFTDDLLDHADVVKFLGRTTINGQECFHVLASNQEMTMQFWIANDAFNLPVRYAITYTGQSGHPQYEASFSNWQVNPSLPLAMFNFQPPPGVTQVRMLATDER
ncbi:DUF2092 domain-containing protein [Paraflavitalea pollutisoli]|uniref:DUF2092 domain-containing protein n=1 Tax=Paraflavitalea pollutisoli TaxID=3034143 RepID=UPI0023ECC04D|nr:DUF2092 domain-containing protein [Paraflavitalea sp. H1-2-19X]